MFVLDQHGRPLQPCAPARARKLLAAGRAVVHHHTPFVIRLKDRTVSESLVVGVEVGVDPGSKFTGVAFDTQLLQNPNISGLEYQHGTLHGYEVGRTKWNRHRTGASKTHTLDALHVGDLDTVATWPATARVATGTGRVSYSRTRTDKYGFPRLRLPRAKQVHGFATGDLVRAVVPSGLKRGTHTGRVAVRTTGSFNIRTSAALVQGIHHRHVQLMQRADGWAYTTQQEGERTVRTLNVQAVPGFLPALKDRVSAPDLR